MTSPFFQTQLDSFALRKSLLLKPKKEVNVFADSAGLQNEYDDLVAGQTLDEDIEHVKGLDIWNVPLTTQSKSCAPSFTHLKSTKDYRQKKAQEGDFPHVKTELLNRILAHRDEEAIFQMGGNPDPFADDEGGLPVIRREGDGTLKKYEATKLAHNEELIHELVLRRMREQINIDTISRMGQTQLKLYIKSIAEDAVAHFKSLKGMLSPKLIQNYVQAALEMVRENKSGNNAPRAGKESNGWAIEDRPVANYEANEMILVRDFEFNMKQAKELRTLVADLGHQIFNAKKEKAYFDDRLSIVRDEYREITKGSDNGAGSGRYTQRRIAVAQPGMVKDHMQTKKLKDEKRTEEAQYVKALAEIEERQKRLNIELKQAEHELKVAKSIKTSCQIQLKKLYYEVLKDEEALMRGTENTKSYAWVLRALWNLGEDVKEDAYPLFLDSKAHEYLIAIAKCQEELEIHCRQNNLSNLLNNLKGFKPLNSVLQYRSDRNHPFAPNLDDNTVDTGASRIDLDEQHRMMAKSLNMLMTEYKERAFEMKKVNLKIRKPAQQVKSYSSKDKTNTGPKWEEVDPKDLAALGLDYPGAQKKAPLGMGGRNASLPKLVATSKPLEKAMDILNQLDELRKDAIEKLTRTYMAKVLDERTKTDLHKTFRLIFGREEGDHCFSKLVTEKKFAEEKMGASIRKIKTKTTSNDFLSPLRMSKSPTMEMRSASTMGIRKGLYDLPSSTKHSRGFAIL